MTEQEQYAAYRDNLHMALATLLEPHHAGAVLDVAAQIVMSWAATQAESGNTAILDMIEKACAEIRGNAAKAAE